MVIQERYEYWGPNGLQFTKWYNTNLTTKPRNKSNKYSCTVLHTEYRTVEGNLPKLEDLKDIPEPIKHQKKTNKTKK